MKVGFIGLGIMGSRMAASLRRAGFELTVWNRTRAKAEAWAAEHGAEPADSPAALASGCEAVITMVVDGPQVEAVLLGSGGVAEAAPEELVCIDCSTIGRAAAVRIGAELAERGIAFVDAPVTGSAPRAQDATLTIMAGGDHADFERARPLLQAMGKLVVHAGPLGHGQLAKLLNNAVAAANTAVLGEALVVAERAGLDLDALVTVMAAGSGASAMLALKAAPMREHDYTTLFKLEHMLKDVRLCLAEAGEAGAPFGFAERAAELLAEAERMGHGSDDFAAIIEAIERRTG